MITMVAGELDFHNTFSFSFDFDYEKTHEIYDRRMAYFIWIIFLIVIPILLSNTLVCIWFITIILFIQNSIHISTYNSKIHNYFFN